MSVPNLQQQQQPQQSLFPQVLVDPEAVPPFPVTMTPVPGGQTPPATIDDNNEAIASEDQMIQDGSSGVVQQVNGATTMPVDMETTVPAEIVVIADEMNEAEAMNFDISPTDFDQMADVIPLEMVPESDTSVSVVTDLQSLSGSQQELATGNTSNTTSVNESFQVTSGISPTSRVETTSPANQGAILGTTQRLPPQNFDTTSNGPVTGPNTEQPILPGIVGGGSIGTSQGIKETGSPIGVARTSTFPMTTQGLGAQSTQKTDQFSMTTESPGVSEDGAFGNPIGMRTLSPEPEIGVAVSTTPSSMIVTARENSLGLAGATQQTDTSGPTAVTFSIEDSETLAMSITRGMDDVLGTTESAGFTDDSELGQSLVQSLMEYGLGISEEQLEEAERAYLGINGTIHLKCKVIDLYPCKTPAEETLSTPIGDVSGVQIDQQTTDATLVDESSTTQIVTSTFPAQFALDAINQGQLNDTFIEPCPPGCVPDPNDRCSMMSLPGNTTTHKITLICSTQPIDTTVFMSKFGCPFLQPTTIAPTKLPETTPEPEKLMTSLPTTTTDILTQTTRLITVQPTQSTSEPIKISTQPVTEQTSTTSTTPRPFVPTEQEVIVITTHATSTTTRRTSTSASTPPPPPPPLIQTTTTTETTSTRSMTPIDITEPVTTAVQTETTNVAIVPTTVQEGEDSLGFFGQATTERTTSTRSTEESGHGAPPPIVRELDTTVIPTTTTRVTTPQITTSSEARVSITTQPPETTTTLTTSTERGGDGGLGNFGIALSVTSQPENTTTQATTPRIFTTSGATISTRQPEETTMGPRLPPQTTTRKLQMTRPPEKMFTTSSTAQPVLPTVSTTRARDTEPTTLSPMTTKPSINLTAPSLITAKPCPQPLTTIFGIGLFGPYTPIVIAIMLVMAFVILSFLLNWIICAFYHRRSKKILRSCIDQRSVYYGGPSAPPYGMPGDVNSRDISASYKLQRLYHGLPGNRASAVPTCPLESRSLARMMGDQNNSRKYPGQQCQLDNGYPIIFPQLLTERKVQGANTNSNEATFDMTSSPLDVTVTDSTQQELSSSDYHVSTFLRGSFQKPLDAKPVIKGA